MSCIDETGVTIGIECMSDNAQNGESDWLTTVKEGSRATYRYVRILTWLFVVRKGL